MQKVKLSQPKNYAVAKPWFSKNGHQIQKYLGNQQSSSYLQNSLNRLWIVKQCLERYSGYSAIASWNHTDPCVWVESHELDEQNESYTVAGWVLGGFLTGWICRYTSYIASLSLRDLEQRIPLVGPKQADQARRNDGGNYLRDKGTKDLKRHSGKKDGYWFDKVKDESNMRCSKETKVQLLAGLHPAPPAHLVPTPSSSGPLLSPSYSCC